MPLEIFSQKVDSLLSAIPTDYFSAQVGLAEQALSSSGPPLLLFGAGGLGRKTLAGLRSLGITPSAFVDNNPKLAGQRIDGVPVLGVAEALQIHGGEAVIVITIWRALATETMQDRIRSLKNSGFKRILPFYYLYWSRPDTFLPHYSVAHPDGVRNEKPGVRAGAALFKDACSQQEFLAQLQWRLDAEANPLDTADAEPIYFCESLYSLQADEVYVDCGGFDGDTLRAFYEATHGKIGKAFVFEPDPLNFKKLCATIATFPAQERARVKAYPNAVGRKSEILTFESIGTVASQVSATGSIRVQCEPLDKILEGEKITYLKMDIEGAEPDAIEGAEMLIRRSRPILAVCLYHRQNHLWTIPLKINSFVEDYEFYLRSHDKDGWDLVLYGVPAERRKRGQPA